MIVDTSAIISILLQESGYQKVLGKMLQTGDIGIGAPTLVECGIVLSARTGKDGRAILSRFLDEIGIITIPFTDAHYHTAVNAWLKFGKGRHPAALNFGDCLTYATTKLANSPLLCVGEDFNKTDLPLA